MTDRRTEVDGQASSPGETQRYADMVEIAAWFGVSHRVIATWRTRYADDHPFPDPDVMTGRTPGWARGRREEIENWERRRPGQGAGGGRPRKSTTSGL